MICLEEININDSTSMYNLGNYYENIKDYDLMIKYYLIAIEHDNSDAMISL